MKQSQSPGSTSKCFAITLALAFTPGLALATNGYFTHGYGVKSLGIGGIGIALPQDALAAAHNPAGTALVGNRFDLGASLFAPRRKASIAGNAAGPDERYSGNGRKYFLLPELGYTRQINERLSFGVAVYGNGGMNTDYETNPYGRFGASGEAGVNLEQLFATPSLAFRINDRHALGVGVNLVYQRFKAKGIGFFDGFSQAPGAVSNRGTDSSTGAGLRLGWIGEVTPGWTVGVAWSSKISASEFDDYRGLFAGSGSFDIPASYGAGVTWRATPKATLAVEVQRIEYGNVRAIANTLAPLLQGNPLGSANGPGFGWKDITVVKIGGSYQLGPEWTVRAGYSHSQQPVPSSETFFNILAPGVVQEHLTLGATWTRPGGHELSAYAAHAFGKRVKGHNSIPASFGGGEANVKLSETILGLSYAWKF